MLDRAWIRGVPWTRDGRPVESRKPSRIARRPSVETLEGRVVLNASLGSIANVSVPSSLGYQVPVGPPTTVTNAPNQTYTVTSSNPDIQATVAQGPFLTFNITHTAASGQPSDVTFTGSLTSQLFNDLTPKTVALWENFVNSGYFTGKDITRIASNFSGTGGPTDFVFQGGAPNPNGTGSSGLPGTPYGLELNQQLIFSGPGSLAVANTGQPNSNDTQFFFTTGPQNELNFGYTIFGQAVNSQANLTTAQNLESVATSANSGLGGEKSLPISPVTITSATLSNVSPYGTIHINATGAIPGETSTIQVTATDPSTNTTAVQTFQVSVVADTTTHPAGFTFSPLVYPVSQNVTAGTATTVQLKAVNNNPNNSAVTTAYSIVSQPTHGTLSQVNPSTGTVVYTPNSGFTGTDTFTYTAANHGGSPATVAGNTGTVTLTVGSNVVPPANTGAVRQIGSVLAITPPPRTDGGTNTIAVDQTVNTQSPANDAIVVTINGVPDLIQPLATAITRIDIYGGKSKDYIVVTPNVDPTIPVLIDGGRTSHIIGGAGPTLMQAWYGRSELIAGSGTNALYGHKGLVKFKPSSATTTIFAGTAYPGVRNIRTYHYRTNSYSITPPSGTFYKYAHGRLIALPTPKPPKVKK